MRFSSIESIEMGIDTIESAKVSILSNWYRYFCHHYFILSKGFAAASPAKAKNLNTAHCSITSLLTHVTT